MIEQTPFPGKRTRGAWLALATLVLGWVVVFQAIAQGPALPGADAPVPAETAPAEEPAAQAPAGPTDPEHMSFLELLLKGRWFMVPIGACSLLGVAIILERLVALRRRAIIPPRFFDGLKQVLREDEDRDAALDYCHRRDSPIARVAAAGVRKLHRDEDSIEQAIEDAGANEVAKLRRNLRMLYGVAAVSPMLGLLGTVWGMIEAFQVASMQGLGQAQSLATGIYEALVTTFAGLSVAIPVLVFYYYFQGKIERLVSDMNDVSVQFVEHYTARAQSERERENVMPPAMA
jgi:biopolymer transport protein ExbB